MLASAVSAALLALASPPHSLAWLAWLAPAPYFWALLRIARGPARRLRAWWCGFLHGFLFLLLLVPWFAAFSPAGYPVAAAYWGLLSGGVSLAAAWLLPLLGRGWAPPLLAAVWTLTEWLRAQGTLAFPWGTLSSTQHRLLPVIQILDLTGAYGLTFLMALLAAGAAVLADPAGDGEPGPGRLRVQAWTGAALILLLGATARGALLLRAPAPALPSVRIAVVQASESRRTAAAEVRSVSPPAEYDARTREAIAAGAELVVWPESARAADVVHDPAAFRGAVDLVRGTGAHLLAGSFVEDPESGLDTNAAVMFSPEGIIRGSYAKVLIVPFGEYLPARPLLGWTERLGMPETDLRAGRGWRPLPWDRGSVGVSICFESAFGYVSRTHVVQGANILAVLTSDGWAGRRAAGEQHLAFSALRAVECRRSLARAAATGISQILDPWGRPLRSIPMFDKGIAAADVPLRSDLTLYARLGDWPVLLCWLILAAGAFSAGRSLRSPGSPQPVTGSPPAGKPEL